MLDVSRPPRLWSVRLLSPLGTREAWLLPLPGGKVALGHANCWHGAVCTTHVQCNSLPPSHRFWLYAASCGLSCERCEAGTPSA